MKLKEQISARLKIERKNQNMTLQALADKMSRDRVTITRYESGKLNMTLDLIEEICEALNLKPEIILTNIEK